MSIDGNDTGLLDHNDAVLARDDGAHAEVPQDEFISVLIRRIQIRAELRIAWLHHLWRQEHPGKSDVLISFDEVKVFLEGTDTLQAQNDWLISQKHYSANMALLKELDIRVNEDTESGFSRIRKLFSLSDIDADFLSVCFVAQFDPGFNRLFGYLQDHPSKTYVTENLVSVLFQHPKYTIYNSKSALWTWQLVEPKESVYIDSHAFAIDPVIYDWILGGIRPDDALAGISKYQPPLEPLQQWPVELLIRFISKQIGNGNRVRIVLSGLKGSGRKTLAADVAALMDLRLLTVNTDTIPVEQWADRIMRCHRNAFLNNTALCWHGESLLGRQVSNHSIVYPIQFIVLEPEQTISPQDDLVDYRIEMPALSIEERSRLWQQYIPQSQHWPAQDLSGFFNQHQVTIGDIVVIANREIESIDEAESFIREISKEQLGDLAQYLETPFTWDDLILPDRVIERLRDFCYEATDRNHFWESDSAQRLFPHGRALMGLFSGEPGTGKTMSAKIISAELGLDLFRIDLSSVVSKYVGETSRNMDRILSRAQNMDVILLFDECDALFAKRSDIKDAQDRFANTDTNYLLQAMESYQGIVVLSTNKKSNIDEAFTRRLRFAIEFPKPDSPQRLLLWKRFVREIGLTGKCLEEEGFDALAPTLSYLSSALDLSAAQIKYAVLSAVFAARRAQKNLAMEHLIRGVDAELMKTGRILSEKDMERIRRNGI